MAQDAIIIGTAGHVDHGKTSLVKALTGVDLDRLPEERERGITIALGFTPLKLPSGRLAGLVDVPGHERLVRTMIAGASGLDAVMLCVSASEGVMPQTREHLDVLRLLGVQQGILVLTKADSVDDELLELAAEELREQVAGTFLADAPLIATSATTGQGIAALIAQLDAITAPTRELDRPFRLPVDRAFARRGFGTVVTGTVWGGRLPDGAEVEILPGGRKVRVRGIQVHGQSVTEARAGSRTALNLSGLEVADVPRGSWICAPGTIPSPLMVDVRYTHLPSAPDLEADSRVVVLHGTREVTGRLVGLDVELWEPGTTGHAQLRLAEPLPCLPGDRFVVRRESPALTLGGGVVIDPFATVTRKARAQATVELLERIEAGDTEAWLERAGPGGLSEAELLRRLGHTAGVKLGERWFAPAMIERHRAALHAALQQYHQLQPLSLGANRKALRVGVLLALAERDYLALLDDEIQAGRIRAEAGRVREPDFEVTLSPTQEAWRRRVLDLVEKAGLEGADRLAEAAPDPNFEALLFLLRDRGELVILTDRVFSRKILDQLAARVREWFTHNPQLDPQAFKEMTGLTRRTAIPLLEWLDSQGVSRRMGDIRVAG